jgi:hypothetical protein
MPKGAPRLWHSTESQRPLFFLTENLLSRISNSPALEMNWNQSMPFPMPGLVWANGLAWALGPT